MPTAVGLRAQTTPRRSPQFPSRCNSPAGPRVATVAQSSSHSWGSGGPAPARNLVTSQMCAIRATSAAVAGGVNACAGHRDPGTARVPTPRVPLWAQPRAHPEVEIGFPRPRVRSNARYRAAKRVWARWLQLRRRLLIQPPSAAFERCRRWMKGRPWRVSFDSVPRNPGPPRQSGARCAFRDGLLVRRFFIPPPWPAPQVRGLTVSAERRASP